MSKLKIETGSSPAEERFSITVTEKGPFLVYGRPPLAEQFIMPNEQNESWYFQEGRRFSTEAEPTALCRCGASKRITYPEQGFNFSGINNFGRKAAAGEYLLLLNNDVEVRNADWLTELLRQCAHPGGAAICGAELFYPDETLQHAGVITGLGGYAGHSHKYRKAGGSGYMFRAATVQDFSAVTGACLLVTTSVWDEVGGLDEAFAVAFNDVDFCLRVRDAGYRIAWTPYAQLTHYESKSRGGDEKDPVKARRFAAEQQRLYEVHGKANILHDPYYNPNLTMDREDFSESDDLRGLKEGRITVQWRE